MRIFLNPGHGGRDSGAIGYGLNERDVVKKIGEIVADNLPEDCQVEIYQYDGLAAIVRESNSWGSDLFVSIHCNAFNGLANGTETYYYYGSAAGRRLAQTIHGEILTGFPTLKNRGVKEAGFYVLKYTQCPAVLVETAFIDNYFDNQLLKESWAEFGRAIARGVMNA